MGKPKMNINDLYDEMFEAIKMVKEDELSVKKANAIAAIGKVIVDAAKTETHFLQITRQTKSEFLLDEDMREKIRLAELKAQDENQKYFPMNS